MWPLTLVDVLAVTAFALSGAWRGRDKRLDALGVVMLAVITAFGGGWLRDLLLSRGIPVSLRSPWYLPLAAGVGLVSVVAFPRWTNRLERAVRIADALGLGLYSASAARLALDAGLPVLSVCLLAVVTGAGGGILRDLIVNEIPLVFRREIYALCAVAGALAMVGLDQLGTPRDLALAAGATLTAGIRLLAIRRGWNLPAPG